MTDQPPVEPLHTALNDLCRRLGLTGDQFAARLGKNRRTLYKWAAEGAPFDSEESLRAWCAAAKPRMWVKPAEQPLADLLRPMADGTEIAPITPAGQAGTLPAADGKVVPSPAQALASSTAELRNLQAEKVRREIDTHKRLYLHRDEVRALVGGLGILLVGELTDLPLRSVENLPPDVPADHRTAIRRAVAAAVETMRGTLTPTIRQRLERLLAGIPGPET